MNAVRTFGLLLTLLALGAVGCGKDKADNSHIQTPNDQPIGMPQPIDGGGKGAQLNGAPLKTGAEKGGGKPLPVEIKP